MQQMQAHHVRIELCNWFGISLAVCPAAQLMLVHQGITLEGNV
jgi:hypothetical protein